MYPGQTSKLSEGPVVATAATIAPLYDVTRLSGTTSISTIVPPQVILDNAASMIVLIPTGGAVGLLTGGNIQTAVTLPNNKAAILVYSGLLDMWYPFISA